MIYFAIFSRDQRNFPTFEKRHVPGGQRYIPCMLVQPLALMRYLQCYTVVCGGGDVVRNSEHAHIGYGGYLIARRDIKKLARGFGCKARMDRMEPVYTTKRFKPNSPPICMYVRNVYICFGIFCCMFCCICLYYTKENLYEY